ncbi:MAG: two-component system NtrC family sensor kinase [Phenylobacterium sp.]|jgi:two-component system NtrC family sensor kinase
MTHDDIDLTGSKILVVDDTPANVDLLRQTLEIEGYRIIAATNGEMALRNAAKTLPDLILLDVMMPGIDGFETCRRLKQHPQLKDIPVIFISAKTETQDVIDGFSVGGVDYIHKPIRHEEVLARVHTHLEIVALFKAQQKLTDELAEKNTALIETQQKLVQSEKMASLGTLTAGIAHEINNPNNFVHVSAQNLEVSLAQFNQFILKLAGDNADDAVISSLKLKFAPLYSHVDIIKEGTERIKLIVRDLKAFTQRDSADSNTIDISKCLQSTINLVRVKYAKVAQFITDIDSIPEWECYPAQLNQVFINLIINACDAIRAKQQQLQNTNIGQVGIRCQHHNEITIITIKDDGCGMSETVLSQIFDPFYTTKDVGEGTGLGLSISYGIVQKHNGELTVTSQLGIGTTFTLTLPHIK